jgi:hypothetical protein
VETACQTVWNSHLCGDVRARAGVLDMIYVWFGLERAHEKFDLLLLSVPFLLPLFCQDGVSLHCPSSSKAL